MQQPELLGSAGTGSRPPVECRHRVVPPEPRRAEQLSSVRQVPKVGPRENEPVADPNQVQGPSVDRLEEPTVHPRRCRRKPPHSPVTIAQRFGNVRLSVELAGSLAVSLDDEEGRKDLRPGNLGVRLAQVQILVVGIDLLHVVTQEAALE